MKSFHFSLESARRWRETQVAVQEAKVVRLSGQLAKVREVLAAQQSALHDGAAQLAAAPDAAAMAAYPGFVSVINRRVQDLTKKTKELSAALAGEMAILIVKNRDQKLLDNLKTAELTRWNGEYARETANFADEAFAASYNREKRRARSSSG
jgi:flagellar export protein FliJ